MTMDSLHKLMSTLCYCMALYSVFFHCVRTETRVKVKVMMKYFQVNGKDDRNKDCDYIFSKDCDPRFLVCIDHPNGNGDPNSCRYIKRGWSNHYQNQNQIWFGDTVGNTISNPITTTITDWTGTFKFKVHVRDDDSGSDDDDIDKFNNNIQGQPGRSESEAPWRTGIDLYGLRARDPTRLKIDVQISCEDNWFSKDCSVNCVAQDDDILGHYTCDADDGKKVCRLGWETPELNCLVKVDDCEDNGCVNGGTCVDGYMNYTCDCMAGYTGAFCGVDINECEPNPCLNGGHCQDRVNYFHCLCSDPYTGEICEHHVCSVEDYCENGGTCYDDGDGNVGCLCIHPYVGRHCDVDKCDILECQNGGSCVNGSCVCPPDYLGQLCEFRFCQQITCENGGTCTGGACHCPSGYTGRYCHIHINRCESDPCQNDGTCRDTVDSYQCRCLPGFNGTHCENQLPPRSDGGGKAIGQVAIATSDGGTPNWAIGMIVAIIVFIAILVIAIALFVTKRRKNQKAAHTAPIVTSDSGDQQSSFPNPLYNTDLGLGQQDISCQAGVMTSSIETTTEKVPFPDILDDKTLVSPPPPPYMFHEECEFDDPKYSEVSSVHCPPGYAALSDSSLPSYSASSAHHYDNPKRLAAVNGDCHHYDNPKRLNVSQVEPHYQVPKQLNGQAVGVETGDDTENSNVQRGMENDYASIDQMRSMPSGMEDSVHNNSTNEMLARDNEGFEEK